MGVAGAALTAGRAMGRSEIAQAAKPAGYALVGIGKLTQTQLIPALKTTKNARLVALVSGHADKAKKVAAENGVPDKGIYSYETFDRIADNPDVDVVYIVLPNSMHAEFTVRAARAGKHVLCEKPMAVTTAECEQMIAACKQAKRQLAIGYALAIGSYLAGLGVSLVTDLPSSPVIVWVMGILGLLVHLTGRNGKAPGTVPLDSLTSAHLQQLVDVELAVVLAPIQFAAFDREHRHAIREFVAFDAYMCAHVLEIHVVF